MEASIFPSMSQKMALKGGFNDVAQRSESAATTATTIQKLVAEAGGGVFGPDLAEGLLGDGEMLAIGVQCGGGFKGFHVARLADRGAAFHFSQAHTDHRSG